MRERIYALDYLKIVAMLFVVVLHVSSYSLDLYEGKNISQGVKISYQILQTFAYPAIHIFVLAGSYFMLDKAPKKETIIYIYAQTWLVCITGLILCIIMKFPMNKICIIQSIIPFFGRAYWFVTDYILLIFFSPYLNILISNIEIKKLFKLTGIFLIVISFCQIFLGFIGWKQNYSNIGLFIFLYLVAACIKNDKIYLKNKMIGWALWIASFIALILSWIGIMFLQNRGGVLQNKEMYFYQYWSPFVIMEAIGMFIIFLNIKPKNNANNEKLFQRLTILFVNSSLVSYLIHMHPIIKNLYTPYRILDFMITDNGIIFFGLTILVSVLIMLFGVIAGFFITHLARKIISIYKE